ncbi:hypothetical protein Glove_5g43 [Diversispora epigaea]|uniref:Uncharacterized protein n=1 Tax=Diversispora epigaea TaxID=1348612 RepID=A0A397JVP0_9GLOM|nr:hypothetical protein Glove_5g43 [Diversispora epigaea]
MNASLRSRSIQISNRIYYGIIEEKKSLNKVNERIANIPRHSQLKVFKKGIQLSRLTASEYRDMMKIMVFVTLLITEIRLPNKSPMHLALVQWYDFIEETPFVYGCPLLRLVEVYNFIEIEVIEDTIHVVPRFDKNNEYFNDVFQKKGRKDDI